jgi:hypothetical protein
VTRSTDDEAGLALLAALVLVAAASLAVATLFPIVQAETGVVSAFVERERVRHAAQAALACAIDALRVEPSLSAVLAGGRVAPWSRSTSVLSAPDARVVDLVLELQRLQSRTTARAFRGANTSAWVPWGGAGLDDLLPLPAGGAGPAIAVFVADDGADGDGRPDTDSNAVVVVEAMAFGARRSRGAALATVRRIAAAPARLEVVSIGEGY